MNILKFLEICSDLNHVRKDCLNALSQIKVIMIQMVKGKYFCVITEHQFLLVSCWILLINLQEENLENENILQGT